MSEPKFTPGPWKVAPMDLRMFRITFDNSCWVDICRNVLTEENANLIAAAPEMYELLDLMLKDGNENFPLMRIADILKKARGEKWK